MESAGKKRQRCVTFSNEEKVLIACVCSKFKHIILKNKKTDHVSSEQKSKAWDKIASEVDSAALNTSYRSADILRRFYENRKREVRKIAAEERKELYATGGREPNKIKKDPCHEIILSIMNTKTVYGLDNYLDGDAEPPSITEPLPTNMNKPTVATTSHTREIGNNYHHSPNEGGEMSKEFDIIYELDDELQWKKYIPSDLKLPINPSLANKRNEPQKPENDIEENFVGTPPAKKRNILSTSRRRPTVEVRALARSDLAEKYDLLLDKRLEIADMLKKKTQDELNRAHEESLERKTNLQLLNLKMEVENIKLQVENEKLRQLQNK